MTAQTTKAETKRMSCLHNVQRPIGYLEELIVFMTFALLLRRYLSSSRIFKSRLALMYHCGFAVADPSCEGYRNRPSSEGLLVRRAALECGGRSNAGVLTASANVSDDAIDPRIFFIKELLYRGSRCEHIDRTRLVVARRRRPGSGRSLVSRGPGSRTRRN